MSPRSALADATVWRGDDIVGESRVYRLWYKENREGKRLDIYKGSWVPYVLPAECLTISSAEAQLGQVHMQLLSIDHMVRGCSFRLHTYSSLSYAFWTFRPVLRQSSHHSHTHGSPLHSPNNSGNEIKRPVGQDSLGTGTDGNASSVRRQDRNGAGFLKQDGDGRTGHLGTPRCRPSSAVPGRYELMMKFRSSKPS